MKVSTLPLALLVSFAFSASSVLCQGAATVTADVTETEHVETPSDATTHATDDSASSLDVNAGNDGSKSEEPVESSQEAEPVQSGPLIDLFGPQLLSLQLIDEEVRFSLSD